MFLFFWRMLLPQSSLMPVQHKPMRFPLGHSHFKAQCFSGFFLLPRCITDSFSFHDSEQPSHKQICTLAVNRKVPFQCPGRVRVAREAQPFVLWVALPATTPLSFPQCRSSRNAGSQRVPAMSSLPPCKIHSSRCVKPDAITSRDRCTFANALELFLFLFSLPLLLCSALLACPGNRGIRVWLPVLSFSHLNLITTLFFASFWFSY